MQTSPPSMVIDTRFANISVGSLFLGTVSSITRFDLVVSLPNQLRGESTDGPASTSPPRHVRRTIRTHSGYLNITDVSDTLTRLMNAVASGESQGEVPDLTQLYTIGQMVRVVVIKLDNSGPSTRVELSTRPELLNAKLNQKSVTVGTVLDVTVDTVEERGYVISTGITGLSAFLLDTHVAESQYSLKKWGKPGTKPVRGENITAMVTEKSGRVLTLSIDPVEINKHTTLEKDVLMLDTVRPGMLVRAKARSLRRFFGS